MIKVSPDVSGLFQVQEDLTEEKKRELEHNAEETYGENDENVRVGSTYFYCACVPVRASMGDTYVQLERYQWVHLRCRIV